MVQVPARPVVFGRASRGLDHELGNDWQCLCSVCAVSVQRLCSVCAVCVCAVSVQCLCSVCAASVKCPCSVCAVSVQRNRE
jgi:hypothetical protein